jgi:exodeoxyribonuclease-5
MRIRKAIQQKKWIDENYDGTMIRKTRIDVESEDGEIEKGIVVHKTQSRFLKTALENSNADTFRDTKIIAWRNKAVNNYNARVREALGFKQQYEKGELLMIASPIELNGTIIASIDEEIVVTDYSESTVKIGNGSLVPIYKLTCERLSYLQAGDVLWLNVCKDETTLASYLNKLAYSAHNAANQKERALYWKEFWETKKKFHSVRYSYAITAHRAQGSTYKTVFIDQADILANSDDRTAFKCLLVATTRPTDLLHTY